MRYRGLIATMVAISVLLFGAPIRAQAPRASVPNAVYDFGPVKQGTRINHSFTVKNIGEEPLRFTGAELSLPGMQARVAPVVLLPGAEGTVTIEWITDHVAGAVTGVARMQWNDPAHSELVLTLKGSVTPPISIEPIPAVFLSTFANESVERTLTIRNNGERALALTRVEPGPHVAASLATVETGKVFTVTVRAAPDTPVGRYEASLTLVTDDPTAGRITLPVHIWVKAELYANPDTVDFGTVRREDARRANAANAGLTQSLFLKKRTGKFEIKSIASDLPILAVTHSPSGPGDSFEIDVRLRPEVLARGKIDGKIRVVTNDTEFPEIVIPVTGTVL